MAGSGNTGRKNNDEEPIHPLSEDPVKPLSIAPKPEESYDRRTSPAVKWILYSLTALAIIGGLYHLWTDPIVTKAPYGRNVTVTLPDNSIVELSGGSEITYYRGFGWIERDVNLNGEAFFNVRRNGRPFVVKTSDGIVTVTGTEFNIRTWAADSSLGTVVTLLRGKLDFASRAHPDQPVTLLAGQVSSITGSHSLPSEPSTADIIQATSWRHNDLSFNAQPLSVVIKEMERRYHIIIQATNPGILNNMVTIHLIRPAGPEDVLDSICEATGLQYQKTDEGFLISSKRVP